MKGFWDNREGSKQGGESLGVGSRCCMDELIQGDGWGRGRDVFSEFLTPERAAQKGWEALTLHHFRPFLLNQGGDNKGKGMRKRHDGKRERD